EPKVNQENEANVNSTNNNNTVSPSDNVVDKDIVYGCPDDPNMPNLEEIVYSDDDDDVGAEADMTNLDTNNPVGNEYSKKGQNRSQNGQNRERNEKA
nr:hypothetical protein [Tanacetum cinerariifolium]